MHASWSKPILLAYVLLHPTPLLLGAGSYSFTVQAHTLSLESLADSSSSEEASSPSSCCTARRRCCCCYCCCCLLLQLLARRLGALLGPAATCRCTSCSSSLPVTSTGTVSCSSPHPGTTTVTCSAQQPIMLSGSMQAQPSRSLAVLLAILLSNPGVPDPCGPQADPQGRCAAQHSYSSEVPVLHK
jgi:hypothetical protein